MRPNPYLRCVVLSSPILLEDGEFKRQTITLSEAREWVEVQEPEIFTNHETVKILGLEPAKERKTCEGYDEALVLQPVHRLEFGREYTRQEIEEIGVTAILISKID